LKLVAADVQILGVNLGRTQLFDVTYTGMAHPEASVALLNAPADIQSVDIESKDFLFLEAENYEFLELLPVDMYINIASMQEMNLAVVQQYISYMRTSSRGHSYFYYCNRVEKTLPDGEVVRLADYGWRGDDEVIIDELCPWYQGFPKSTPPFWAFFDGPIRHRLVRLA